MAITFGGSVLKIIIDGQVLQDSNKIKTYEYEVQDQLRRILDVYGHGAYKTGRWLMEELTKTLTIQPSQAEKHDSAGSTVMDPQSHPVIISDINASAQPTDPSKSEAPARIFGVRGLGSDVLIKYSPSAWWYIDARRIGVDARKHQYVQLAPNDRFYLSSDKKSIQPDDILFHEMFHAYRQMNGVWINKGTDNFDSDYGSKEEFFAVVVTNIYVSERNTTYEPRALRGKYNFKTDGSESIFNDLENDPKNQDDDHHFSTKKFYDRYKDAIGEMISDMSLRFRDRLASVKAQFNPIAMWVDKHPNG